MVSHIYFIINGNNWKLRECGWLLNEVRKVTKNPELQFYHTFDTKFNNKVVVSAQIIASWNLKEETYRASSLELHYGTTLM